MNNKDYDRQFEYLAKLLISTAGKHIDWKAVWESGVLIPKGTKPEQLSGGTVSGNFLI